MIKVFGYLQANPDGKIVVDISDPPIHKVAKYSGEQSWSEFYTDTEEDIPHDMPEPYGYLAKLTAFVDSDHAHDKVTRKSVSGIIILLSNTPILWWKTVETSTYGAKPIVA